MRKSSLALTLARFIYEPKEGPSKPPRERRSRAMRNLLRGTICLLAGADVFAAIINDHIVRHGAAYRMLVLLALMSVALGSIILKWNVDEWARAKRAK